MCEYQVCTFYSQNIGGGGGEQHTNNLNFVTALLQTETLNRSLIDFEYPQGKEYSVTVLLHTKI